MIINKNDFKTLVANTYNSIYNTDVTAKNVQLPEITPQFDIHDTWFTTPVIIANEEQWLTFIPDYRLVDALLHTSYDDNPEDVSANYTEHIDLDTTNDERLRYQIKQWLNEDCDDAINEIMRPLAFKHVVYQNTDCVIAFD